MSGRNKEVVGRVDAAFAEGDVEGFLSFCAEDVEWTVVGDRTVKGKDAIREWMASMDGEPPVLTPHELVAEGDLVAAHGDMTMNEEGSAVPYAYCDIYRLRDGKIVELRSFVVRTETE